MENKNQTVVIGLVMIVLGAVLGYSVRGMRENKASVPAASYPAAMMDMNHDSMSGMMEDMTVGLKGKIGDDFDKAFLDEMIVHHEGAVDMANLVLEKTSREELRNLAFDIIAAQTTEIEAMNAWRKAWFTK